MNKRATLCLLCACCLVGCMSRGRQQQFYRHRLVVAEADPVICLDFAAPGGGGAKIRGALRLDAGALTLDDLGLGAETDDGTVVYLARAAGPNESGWIQTRRRDGLPEQSPPELPEITWAKIRITIGNCPDAAPLEPTHWATRADADASMTAVRAPWLRPTNAPPVAAPPALPSGGAASSSEETHEDQ